MKTWTSPLTAITIHAAGGGQAAGLHAAGFRSLALIESDAHAAETLRANFRDSSVLKVQPEDVMWSEYRRKADLLTAKINYFGGGIRDDVPPVLECVKTVQPLAVLLDFPVEVVLPPHRFHRYRNHIMQVLHNLGYVIGSWGQEAVSDYGVPQVTQTAPLVALVPEYAPHYYPPNRTFGTPPDAFKVLATSMRERFGTSPDGQRAYVRWAQCAGGGLAPRLDRVNGRCAWMHSGIDMSGIADSDPSVRPERDLYGPNGPRLTIAQVTLLHGFPPYWTLSGSKQMQFRQIVRSSSPPVAEAYGRSIRDALLQEPVPTGGPGQGFTEVLPPDPLTNLSMDTIDVMHYGALETVVVKLLHRDGYRVLRSGGGSGDQGKDVVAEDEFGRPIVVQVKHGQGGNGSVGQDVAQHLLGSDEARKQQALCLIVANRRYTGGCLAWAKENPQLRLIGREELKRWAQDREPLTAVLSPPARNDDLFS